MAVARPLRFLGAVTIVLFFFLAYLFIRPPPTIVKPGGQNGEIIENMERDPLLDREAINYLEPKTLQLTPSQPSANPPSPSGAPTTTAPTIPTPLA
jgi:hypothetical protein